MQHLSSGPVAAFLSVNLLAYQPSKAAAICSSGLSSVMRAFCRCWCQQLLLLPNTTRHPVPEHYGMSGNMLTPRPAQEGVQADDMQCSHMTLYFCPASCMNFAAGDSSHVMYQQCRCTTMLDCIVHKPKHHDPSGSVNCTFAIGGDLSYGCGSHQSNVYAQVYQLQESCVLALWQTD